MQAPTSIYIPNELFFAEVQAQIRQGKKVRIRVRGNSMLPFIRNNDEALLIPPTPEKIKKGTPIVAVTDELGIVLHRIYRIDGNRITLLGDGNIHQFEHTSPNGSLRQSRITIGANIPSGPTVGPCVWQVACGWRHTLGDARC